MIVNNISDVFEKFKISWLTSFGLTIATPKLELYLPIVLQVLFIVFTQLFSILVDRLRLKYLSQKTITKVIIQENKVDLETTEINENNDVN